MTKLHKILIAFAIVIAVALPVTLILINSIDRPDEDMTGKEPPDNRPGTTIIDWNPEPGPLDAVFQTDKDGFTVTPLSYTATGVEVSSSFALTTPFETTAEELAETLSIDGQPALHIVQNSTTEFLITPSMELSPNSLYVIMISREDEDDVSWAFQTTARFQIVSNYPHDTAVNVPVNTGIEITFSDEGYTPIETFFSITPNVEGAFQYHKNTAVFIPAKLEYRTVYTVTLRAGIKLGGTNEELTTDRVFSFETEAEPAFEQKHPSETVHFSTRYSELPTTEAPRMGMRTNSAHGTQKPDPKITVYKFGSYEEALSAIKELTSVPRWAWFVRDDNFIDTSALTSVMSFNAREQYDNSTRSLTLPDKLSQGFYLVHAELEESQDQIVLQITDLPVHVVADDNKAIVWVNDITTGAATANAEVLDVSTGKTVQTDENGIAILDRMPADDGSEHLIITSQDGKTCLWLRTPRFDYWYWYGGYDWWGGVSGGDLYWTALQLDRTLFKSDDNVNFFGFVQDRRGEEEISNVTVTLTRGFRGWDFGARDLLHRQVVPVRSGTYSGEIPLPNLDPGSYNIIVNHGDIILGNIYFSVQYYVKPPYMINLTSDKVAAFAGETVTFDITAEFFDGTPVSNLNVSYSIYGSSLNTSGYSEAATDIDGKISIRQTISPQAGSQGEASLWFNAEATLPEMGLTTRYAYVRAFINNIDVSAAGTRTDGNAKLTVDVNTITLERLNNGTATHYRDFLDTPVAGKHLNVAVYRVYYVKTEVGTYYDFVEKRNMPRYWYERMEEHIDSFSMTTNTDGTATREFKVPDREFESYYAKITTGDGNGRRIEETAFIGRDYSNFFSYAGMNDYYLDGALDNYAIGQNVTLTVMRDTDPVTRGGFLFVNMQNGILDFHCGSNPYTFTFAREHIPNVAVMAYYFDGSRYHTEGWNMQAYVNYDFSANDLTIEIQSDKAAYKPGDTCALTVTVKDKSGNPVQTNLNISIVDEALFALQDYSVDTLRSLYHHVSTGLKYAHATHRFYIPDLGDDADEESEALYDEAPLATPAAGETAGSAEEETYLRELFKDTAFFATVQTNARGEATHTFRLPDNITSWRLTASGISNTLYAGNTIKHIIVTNPMFLNYSTGDVFLTGDTPAVGVNAYGTSLTGAETIAFEVWDENNPETVFRANGAAFERVNIPLWEMKNEGVYALIIKATASNGTSDMVRHQYQVLTTHREVFEAAYYDVTTDTVFEVGSGGLTNITFTDRGRSELMWQLIHLKNVDGNRLEALIARREAEKLLTKYFPDYMEHATLSEFNIREYQRSDGGIAFLPHSESDLTTTVKVMPYILTQVSTGSLADYLYDIFEEDNAENKVMALYGLALLRQPVMAELNDYLLLEEISAKDAVYLALAYISLGETEIASRIYASRIVPHLEHIAPMYRIDTGVDQDDILASTSAAAVLATKLDKSEKDGLHQYIISNSTTDIIINIERLSYIEHEITARTGTGGSITYTLFGETFTRELEKGFSHTLRIPAQNINEFKLTEVTGDVGAVSHFKVPMTEIGNFDDGITIDRTFYRVENTPRSATGNRQPTYTATETFEQGDLVRVELKIDYSAKALHGVYSATDYLPAGLAFVDDSARIQGETYFGRGHVCYATIEGRKITFYDFNSRFDRVTTYYYYARVISPGTFKAEGTLVRNLTVADYFATGEDIIINIPPA